MIMNKDNSFLCPSAPLTDESFLFGKINKKSEVEYMDGVISLSLNAFKEIKNPEKYFRFTMPCKSNKCRQWENGECSLPSTLQLADISKLDYSISEKCAIKSSCRWFHQEGDIACYTCKYVITNTLV